MQRPPAPRDPASRPTISDLMTALVAELVEAEGVPAFAPLDEQLTLATVLADLCRLAGEPVPTPVEQPLARACLPGAAEAAVAPAGASPVGELCARLLAELVAGDVSQPLAQRFTLAFIWSDLCRLAGEPLPPGVQARLDAPAVAGIAPWRRLAS